MIDIEKHDGEVSGQVNNAGAELREQLEMRCSEIIMRVNEDGCSLAECKNIASDLAKKNAGSIASIVEQLLMQDAFDGDCVEVLVQTFTTLSDKLHQFKAYTDEMKLLDEAKGYLDPSSPLYEVIKGKVAECSAGIKALKEEKRQAEAERQMAQEEQARQAEEARQRALEEEAHRKQLQDQGSTGNVPETSEPPKKNNLLYMIGGAVVAAGIAAYVIMCPAAVPVTYSVPADTKVMIDGKDMGSKLPVELKVGEHKVALEHPVIVLEHPSSINVVKNEDKKPVGLKLITGAQLPVDKKAIVENAYKLFMEDYLKNVCTKEKMEFAPNIYAANADANGKISASHKAFRKLVIANDAKSMTIDNVKVTSSKVELIDNNKKIIVVSEAEVLGKADADNLKYIVKADFVVDGKSLKVSALNGISLE